MVSLVLISAFEEPLFSAEPRSRTFVPATAAAEPWAEVALSDCQWWLHLYGSWVRVLQPDPFDRLQNLLGPLVTLKSTGLCFAVKWAQPLPVWTKTTRFHLIIFSQFLFRARPIYMCKFGPLSCRKRSRIGVRNLSSLNPSCLCLGCDLVTRRTGSAEGFETCFPLGDSETEVC